ncbi:MAG: bifunctional glycosyltransferase/CDP-glycerol:glycerophosphate glycerophosphotransferase [Clostridium sp.]|uniref:bifunctional glycosyltransferase/CDP-glycerol:glycerophosphate glycerophosphotransferase n=1 Tax=Clostridium sp. TaxID=1506 RepID=UPI003EE78290
MKKVSVIIPVYNVEAYIKETLDSLFNQTLKDFEVILIDDGSTDKSKEIIENYVKNLENFRLIEQKNGGPSKARNRGILEAKGEYIVFMDSDDIIPIDSLEMRYDLAVKKNAEVIVCGTYKYDGKNKWPMENHFLKEGEKNIRDNYDLLWTLGPCNKLFKTSIICDVAFPQDIKYAEDQAFVMEAFLRANKVYATKNVGYYYRMRSEEGEASLTNQIQSKSAEVLEQVKKSWEITCGNIEKYCTNKFTEEKLKVEYFNRLVLVDIWPPLKRAIIYGDEKTKIQALKNIKNLVVTLESEVFNKSSRFRWILTQGIVDKYLFMNNKVRDCYVELLIEAYKRFDVNSLNYLQIHYGDLYKHIKKAVKKKNKIYLFRYLVKRKLKKIPKIIENILIKNSKYMFNIFKLLPIKKELVILATNKSKELSGNLLYINRELEKNEKYEVRVYLDNNRGFKESLKMYRNFARAKYIVLDDYYRQIYGLKFKKEVEVVQVWHACGAFKKFGFSAIGKADSNTKEFELNAHSAYTKVITSSKNIVKEYAEAFNIDEKNVLPLGVPRTDIMLDEEYRSFVRRALQSEYPEIKNKKIILYAPTFRGGPKERKNFKLELNPTELLKNIGEDYILILKFHPSVQNGLKDVLIPKELEKRVINLESKKDINDLIAISEIVVTDYSSVVFEGALLDKKIIMFAYDKEEYLRERDFYYEYDSFVPGKIAKTNEDIVEIINRDDFDMNRIKEFKSKFFDHYDGQASKRLVENVFN